MQSQPQIIGLKQANLEVFPPHLQALLKQYPKDPVALLKDRTYEELSEMFESFKCFQMIEDNYLARRVQLMLISLSTRIKIYKQLHQPLLTSEQAQNALMKNSQNNSKSNAGAGQGAGIEFIYKNLTGANEVYYTGEIQKFGEIKTFRRNSCPLQKNPTYEQEKQRMRIVDNYGQICLPEEEIQARLSKRDGMGRRELNENQQGNQRVKNFKNFKASELAKN